MIQKVVVERNYEITLNWWSHANDPDVYPYFHSTTAGTGNNIPGYKDPKMDKMLEEGRSTSDLAKRKAIYDQFQQYASEVQPYIFLWYPQEIQVLSSNLEGVPDLGLREAVYYANEWSIKK
jgi:peptide/nickel transport system substrate-binding protein